MQNSTERSLRRHVIRLNDLWDKDFFHDKLTIDRALRVLTVVDTFSRYSPVIDLKFSYRGEDVVATLERFTF